MKTEIDWPEGEWYSCTDPESLTCTDPWEAIEQYLDAVLDPKMTVAEVEAEIAKPLTVTAYVPVGVTDDEIQNWAGSLLDTLVERFDEEHGDQVDGDPTDPGSGAPSIMLEAVTKIVKGMHCWSCKESGHIDLTADQVLALAREENPDWFEAQP